MGILISIDALHLTLLLILKFYICHCEYVNTFQNGMKEYTLVLNLKGTHQFAESICKNNYDSTLAVVIDDISLELFSTELYKLKNKITTESRKHAWIRGQTNAPYGTWLNLEKIQQKDNGSACLSLSNSPTNNSHYNVSATECSDVTVANFLCEKTTDLVKSSATFGPYPNYDTAVRRFSDHRQMSMITAVHVYEYEDNFYHYISCISFTYGYITSPCRGNHEHNEAKHTLQLQQDEYITEVTGEQLGFISQIKFVTNKGHIFGPYGKTMHSGQFSAHMDGSPLLYVSGVAGMWLYQVQFHFFGEKGEYSAVNTRITSTNNLGMLNTGMYFYLLYEVMHLMSVTNPLAARVYMAIKSSNLEQLVEFNEKYQHMLHSVATKACYIFTSQQHSQYAEYESGCTLKLLLEQLHIFSSTTDALKNYLPRSLMKISDYNSEVLLNELKEVKSFHNLLTELTFKIETVGFQIESTVISVNQQVAQNLANFFTSASDFDKRVAVSDRQYMASRITTLQTKSSDLVNNLNSRLKLMLIYAIGLTASEVVERSLKLASAIAKAANPFGIIFGTTDIVGVADRIEDLTMATRNLAHATKLMSTLKVYVIHLTNLQNKFATNENQIAGIKAIVDKFPKATDVEKNQLVDSFLAGYADYDSQASSHEISYALTLLSQVIDEGCNLIDDSTGTLNNIVKTIVEVGEIPAHLIKEEPDTICTQLQPLLAQLGEMYHTIYSLQFEMIEALKRIAQANIAETMAAKISDISVFKKVDIQTVSIGSMMVEIRYQAVAHARCQELEFLHGGKRPEICRHFHFTDNLISEIIAYDGTMHSSETDTFAFIPTNPTGSGSGEHYLNIQELLTSNGTHFQVPLNDAAWLVKYKWLPDSYFHSQSNKETSYFVNRFELYIPGLKCKDSTDYSITVDVESATSVRLFSERAPPTYIIPSTLFRFTYHQSNSCSTGKAQKYAVRNNDLQLTKLKDRILCVDSEGTSNNALLPTVYSYWTIKLLIPHTCKPVMDIPIGFNPLATVRLGVKQVLAKDINDCWPDTRCPVTQRCVDGILNYTCQGN